MPELPELEAVRLTVGPRVQGRLITAAEVNSRQAHLLRHPPDDFVDVVPIRHIAQVWRRGKHPVFDLELARGGDVRHLVINPMLGGRFQLVSAEEPRPTTWVFALRLSGGDEFRYL